MFQAFFNTVKAIDGKIYLNLNPSVKFFQNEALNDTFYNMGDPRRIAEEFTNRSVMTYYNNRVYTITEIDFKKDPSHKFHLTSKKRDISYADYLLEQYKIKVRDMTQPLLKCHIKRTGQNIYLVPECCVLTGITE